ncbi:MAG: hypothetical protein ACHRHE_15160 [Tepidisphaerales bacterium]
MTTTELEKRMTTIERDLASLKPGQAADKVHPVHVIERIHGAFENDQAFREARRLGRRWRKSENGNARSAKAGRK